VDYKLLRTIIKSNPRTIGLWASGRDQDIADILNDVDVDIQVNRGVVPSNEFLSLLDPSEFASLTQIQSQSFGLFLASGSVDMNAVPVDQLAGIMPDKTKAKINAHKTRPGSISERDLGGRVTAADVGKALKPDRPEGRANNAN